MLPLLIPIIDVESFKTNYKNYKNEQNITKSLKKILE